MQVVEARRMQREVRENQRYLVGLALLVEGRRWPHEARRYLQNRRR
jgi:hypothetical protein